MEGGSRSDCKPTFSANIQAYLDSLASVSKGDLKERLELFNKVIEDYNLASTVFGVDALIIPPLDLLHKLADYADPDGKTEVTEETTKEHYDSIHNHLFALTNRAGFTAERGQAIVDVSEIPTVWYSYKRASPNKADRSNTKFDAVIDDKRSAGFEVQLNESGGQTAIKAKFIGAFMNKTSRGAKFVFEAEDSAKKKQRSRVSTKIEGGAIIKDVQQLRDAILLASKAGVDSMTRLAVSVVNGFYASISKNADLPYLKLLKTGSPELSAFRILNYCCYNDTGRKVMEDWGGVTCDYMLSAVWTTQDDASKHNVDELERFKKEVLLCNADRTPDEANILVSNYFALTASVCTHYTHMLSKPTEMSISDYLTFVYIMSGVELGRTTNFPVMNRFAQVANQTFMPIPLPPLDSANEAKDKAMLDYLREVCK